MQRQFGMGRSIAQEADPVERRRCALPRPTVSASAQASLSAQAMLGSCSVGADPPLAVQLVDEPRDRCPQPHVVRRSACCELGPRKQFQ